MNIHSPNSLCIAYVRDRSNFKLLFTDNLQQALQQDAKHCALQFVFIQNGSAGFSLSTLKWPFISLGIYYLQIKTFKKYTFKISFHFHSEMDQLDSLQSSESNCISLIYINSMVSLELFLIDLNQDNQLLQHVFFSESQLWNGLVVQWCVNSNELIAFWPFWLVTATFLCKS